LIKNIYLLFFLLTQDKEQSVHLLTWLFLPGTIIHELSHLLVAEVLGVATGELSFKPEIKENDQVHLGSLKVAKTGPLRHFLIGLAPTLAGITSIALITHFTFLPLLQKTLSLSFQPINYQNHIINLTLLFLISYLLFCLSNTMFSSKQDLKTILFPILLTLILLAFFWSTGLKIALPGKLITGFNQVLKTLNYALLAALIIDLIFLIFIRLLLGLKLRRLTN
jgi:hypothetical protein